MCFEELTLIELRSYVATSLEDLALFVLPNTRNDEIEDPGLDLVKELTREPCLRKMKI